MYIQQCHRNMYVRTLWKFLGVVDLGKWVYHHKYYYNPNMEFRGLVYIKQTRIREKPKLF